ncbi:MAG: Clp protease ClpP [Nitrososphaeraceae archaeon]
MQTTTPTSNPYEEEFRIQPYMDKRKPYKQYEQTFQFQHVHYYITSEIGEPDGYVDMIYRIQMADPNDTIYIHLNTPGGQLDTGVQLINAMQNSQANIITILEGSAYSLGTLIFLAGDQMIVNNNCMMMFHNFRGGIVGKGNEISLQLDATVKWFTELAKQIYIPFLSEDEFSRILKGEDLWMNSEEVRERLKSVAAATKARNKKKSKN